MAIAIANNGMEIVEEVNKRGFNLFLQPKKLVWAQDSGLSICYQIVADAHGGQLFCESETGVETTLTVE